MRFSIREFAVLTLSSFVLAADAALAGAPAPGAPAPIVGAGIPALLAFGWIYRRIKRHRDS